MLRIADRLGMGDYPSYFRLRLLQLHLEPVDDLMHGLDRLGGRKATVIMHENTFRIAPYPHIVDVADALLTSRERAQESVDLLLAAPRQVIARKHFCGRGLDRAFHLDLRAAFAWKRGRDSRCHCMGNEKRHPAVV